MNHCKNCKWFKLSGGIEANRQWIKVPDLGHCLNEKVNRLIWHPVYIRESFGCIEFKEKLQSKEEIVELKDSWQDYNI